MNREYRVEDLTEEEAAYIGRKINEIVPREVDTDEEEFVLKVESESGEIVGGCIAEAYEYHWSRMFLNILWVDERYRHHGSGSMIIRELERIAKENACRVVTRNCRKTERFGSAATRRLPAHVQFFLPQKRGPFQVLFFAEKAGFEANTRSKIK